MEHLFIQGDENHPVLLLLHGTGGTEEDLIPLAKRIDELASVLSLRGDVNEQGMNRFFKRISPGVFDEVDLVKRTHKLIGFIEAMGIEYSFESSQVVGVGYSNGANMLASMLMHDNSVLSGAILHHPMVPLRGVDRVDLAGVEILITAGRNDPMCPVSETESLVELFKQANACVEVAWFDEGHQLTNDEVRKAKSWYEKRSDKWI